VPFGEAGGSGTDPARIADGSGARVTAPGMAAAEPVGSMCVDGRAVPICHGDSVAAAMLANGLRALRETTAAGSRRGIWCGMGVCHECTMAVDGSGGSLACMTEAAAGMTVTAQPSRRPVSSGTSAPTPEIDISPDVLVVGAGPAGLAAARDLAAGGVQVVVVDERPGLGGQYYKQPAAEPSDPERLDAQYREGRRLIDDARRAGVTFLSEVMVWGAAGPDLIMSRSAEHRWTMRPRALVLATGAYERGVPIPGWTLPGVMTTGAGQSLLRRYQVAPGARVLVAGNGPLNIQLAAELVRAGVHVVGLVEAAALFRPGHSVGGLSMAWHAPGLAGAGLGYLTTLLRHRIGIHTRSVIERLTGDPEQGVRTAVIARLAPDGTATGRRREVRVDAVCLGYGFLPSSELARTLGCAQVYQPATGTFAVDTDLNGRTSIDGVWALGDGAAVRGAKFAQAQGRLAAAEILGRLGGRRVHLPPDAVRHARRQWGFQQALHRVFAAPVLTDQLADAGTVICRCEDVTMGDLSAADLPAMAAPGSVKRMTRAGMGKCQGRYCGPVLADRSSRLTGVPIGARSGFAPQSPVKPVPVKDIAAIG
jgi:NADPH-dependent 2,4-dienoyl-CoA reductase/sulfur reductase-like enzyme